MSVAAADLLPQLSSDYPYSTEAKDAFLSRTNPFTSKMPERGFQVKNVVTADYLRHLKEEGEYRTAIPEIKRNALDLSQSYASLGNNTKALRRFILSGIARIEQAGDVPLGDLYRSWEEDYLAQEQQAYVRSELVSWELFTQRKRDPSWSGSAAFRAEQEASEWGSAFLEEVLKRLDEIRRFDSIGKIERGYKLAAVTPVDELPSCQKTELYRFSDAAVQSFLNRTRPWSSELSDASYEVQLLTSEEVLAHWEKQSVVASQKASILENARDDSKPFHDLGVTTKKVRLFLKSGLERLRAEGDKPLSAVFVAWVEDHQQREPVSFVRSELVDWELHEQRKKNKQWSGSADFQREMHHSEYEKAFLRAVRDRLGDMQRLDEEKVRERDDALREERRLAEAEARAAAEEAARDAEEKRKEEEAREKEQREKEEEERRVREEAEAERAREAQAKKVQEDTAAAVSAIQDKMAAYQAALAELQRQMMAGEIDGAAFGAAVAGLSAKYL